MAKTSSTGMRARDGLAEGAVSARGRRAAWTRRALLSVAWLAGSARGWADAGPESDAELVHRLTGLAATPSPRLRLVMPPVFANGYTVPLTLEVDSPMSEAEYVREVRVFAPRNPIVLVAGFRFSPSSGRAYVSTRIRLAAPQDVIAVAELSDGSALMAKTPVSVDTNGCA